MKGIYTLVFSMVLYSISVMAIAQNCSQISVNDSINKLIQSGYQLTSLDGKTVYVSNSELCLLNLASFSSPHVLEFRSETNAVFIYLPCTPMRHTHHDSVKDKYPIARDITFTKVTQGAVVNDGGWNYGMVWADFNNDNFPDLFITNNDSNNGKLNFLYMNNGDGTFTKVTEGPVVTDGGSSYAATATDINWDENIDLFVANHNENNFLYYGNGDGTFEKVTTGIVVSDGGKSVGCSFTDYDQDSYPDLYVANRDQKNALYHATGHTSFEKIQTGAIANDIANSSGCAWGDYDNDNFPDLYVANSGSVSCLYHNQNGIFSKIESEPFISDISSCAGASWGDCDNDGDLDLFVATGQLGMYVNWFYVNNGAGSFTKITGTPMTNEANWSSGSAWGDYDKDGDLDLAVGGYDGDNLLFNNDGAGNFSKVLNNEFVNDGGYTEGLGWADIDNDGDLDIFTAKNNYFGGNNSLFLNNGNENNWLKVKLTGDGLYGNRNAIGAKIYVYSTISGQHVMQYREVTAQSGGGQGGQNDLVQFFGMGDALLVDSLVVHWMGYEFRRNYSTPANQLVNIYLGISDSPENPIQYSWDFRIYPNPVSNGAFIEINPELGSSVNLVITDAHGRMVYKTRLVNSGFEFYWDLKGHDESRVVPGVYYCHLISGRYSECQKIIVVQ